MSNSHLQLAWPLHCGGPTPKAVLIALADHANERGECYPSIHRIANRTELSERTVRNALRVLEVAGLIRSTKRIGTSSVYTLTIPTPAVDAEGQEIPPSPAGVSAPPRLDVPAPPASAAPKPSMNHHLNHKGIHSKGAGAPAESSNAGGKGGNKLPRALGVRELVAEGVERQHAEDWLKVRKDKKLPLTQTAFDGMKKEATKAGLSLAEAVKVSATHSWAGFKAAWYARQKQEIRASAARISLHTGFENCNYGKGGAL